MLILILISNANASPQYNVEACAIDMERRRSVPSTLILILRSNATPLHTQTVKACAIDIDMERRSERRRRVPMLILILISNVPG